MPKPLLFKLGINILVIFILVIGSLKATNKLQNNHVFIENKGQWNKEILFKAEIPTGHIILKEDRITYLFRDLHHNASCNHDHKHNTSETQNFTKIDVEFLNSGKSKIVKSIPEVTNYNYYLGKNPSGWGENCKSYKSIKYENIYNNIDLVFYFGEKNQLKYDLILKPGSNSSLIEFQYSKNVELLLEDGCVFAKNGQHSLMENRPLTYEVNESNEKKEIECKFKLKKKRISFDLPTRDKTKTVIIDPELVFSTFSGSYSINPGYAACYDKNGNLYSGGVVNGPNFPNTTDTRHSGDLDMAILKFNEIGTQLIYATFIGGEWSDSPHSMITNNEEELIILGTTGSHNFPTTIGAFDETYNGGDSLAISGFYKGSDIAVSKLNKTGNLVASTYVGGSKIDGLLKFDLNRGFLNNLISNYGDVHRGEIVLDSANNIYIASTTESEDFPVTSNIQATYRGGNSDAVILSLNSDLTELRWSTFLGGHADDAAYSIRLDTLNNIIVGGGTESSDFPTSNNALQQTYSGFIDGFISKIDPVNDLILESTFLGTQKYDQVYLIDLDSNDNVYAFGQTLGNYPVTSGSFSNANGAQFIHKLSPDLNSTSFSTVFGTGDGMINISPTAFTVNECNNIFLSGWGGGSNITSGRNTLSISNTSNLPITSDAYMPTTDGSDFYLMVLSADGSELIYGTFFGGTDPNGDHVDGGTSRIDKTGILYQSVCDCAGSDSFPITPGAWSSENNAECNNAAFKFDLAALHSRFTTNSPQFDLPGIANGCIPFEIVFINTSVGGQEFIWNLGDGTTSNEKDTLFHTYDIPGEYAVSLTIRDDRTCKIQDISYATINVFDDLVSTSNDTTICEGDSIPIQAFGGVNYYWTPETEFADPFNDLQIVSPQDSSSYTVEITTPNNCRKSREIEINVIPSLDANLQVYNFNNESQASIGCVPFSVLAINSTEYDEYFLIDFGDGTTSSGSDTVVHTYNEAGSFIITLKAFSNLTCNPEDSLSIPIEVYDDEVSVLESVFICEGESQPLFASGGLNYTWFPTEGLDDPNSPEPNASPANSITYEVEITTQNGCKILRETEVVVTPFIQESFSVEPIINNCGEHISYQIVNKIEGYNDSYLWDFGDGFTSTENEPVHSYSNEGTFIISLDLEHNCSIDQTIEVTNSNIFIPNAFSPNGDGINDFFNINYSGAIRLSVFDRNGKKVYYSKNYSNDWNANNVSAGTYFYDIHFNERSDNCTGWLQIIK